MDEVDSVLIDEARTPLIISGPVMAAESNHQYERYKPLVDQLVRRQNTLCNRLITEAKEAAAAGHLEQAGLKLFQVQMGQPKTERAMMINERAVGTTLKQLKALSSVLDTPVLLRIGDFA